MTDVDRVTRRNTKIARTLIRLRHSLAADEEIADYLEKSKKALVEGMLPELDIQLSDITNPQ